MITKTHYFFLLNLSPWPTIISGASFNLLLSLLLLMKFNNIFCFIFSLLSVMIFSMFWWIIYSVEFNLEGKNSLNLEKGLKFSMILFISSEVFFFFSFFWSYFHYFLSPMMELGISWPPVNVEGFDFLGVPLINTLVLMGSGLAVTVSHYFLMEGNMKMSNFWLTLTIFLGMFFTYLQLVEYNNSFFSIGDGSFGSSFFMLTGFHGIHVLVGSLFLLISLTRSMFLSNSLSSYLSFELSAWYWHFVDVVWIFLYFFLYYMIS